jgi:hypothetical protein
MADENSGSGGQGCLFGWQHAPNLGGRGRPPHVRTDETSNKIKLLLALGWSNERIANAVGITQPTLRKHYFSELKVRMIARDALDARRAELLWSQVERGNVGAMKAFHQLLLDNDRMKIADELRRGANAEAGDQEPRPKRAAKPIPEGKKAEARRVAQDMIGADPDLLPLQGRMN